MNNERTDNKQSSQPVISMKKESVERNIWEEKETLFGMSRKPTLHVAIIISFCRSQSLISSTPVG